ncbi:hypothetical protein L3556_09625 [Candidatus Synechococcus calcipolaris G9]|uniref:KGK domain-containing protein n=1 Tax=Candidatus Synechococcus calcipolaris G9 TaxID=1497997 RepID=A0ABT6F023_9SYNE|nr:KGK domain-containing protein [Candidatus Synechococcus calcipolaris]MDG2991185.1 hypothetical protein [Candidatus Synechococcus calcipolaris G9]
MPQPKYYALSSDDVVRLDNADENVKRLRSIITNDMRIISDVAFLSQQALHSIGYNGNCPQELIDTLISGIPGQVMFQNEAGWKKGTIKLEFNFYPDAEDADPESFRSPLDDF